MEALLLHRLLLDRLLGASVFQLHDSSAEGQTRHLRFRCGCVATERRLDRYAVIPCPAHHDTVTAEQA
ncbi:MAG TPA: hypothetical protein VGU66_02670 [Candidatus Elarobacter sp.]|nr:hypothetical protein [Candidatus Elarobacter sp.]